MFKILIVDDESLLKQGFIHMTNWLEHDFQVIGEASNGVAALEQIEKNTPDIVVTDIRMPVMDGIELTRIIKERYPDIQVIILSSYNDFDYVKETLKLGVLDYILKPKMKFEELLYVLEKAKTKKIENKSGILTPSIEDLEKLRDYFLKSLMINSKPDNKSIENLMKKYEIALKSNNLLIFITYLNADTEFYNQFNSDISELHYSIMNEISQIISTDHNAYSFIYNDKMVVTILNCLQEEVENIYSGYSKVIENFNIKHKYDLYILLSDTFDGYENIYQVFHKTMKISQYIFYKVNNRILTSSDFNNSIRSLEIDYKSLDLLIEKLDFEKLSNNISEFVTEPLFRGVYLEPSALKNIFVDILYHILHKLTEMNFDMKGISNNKFIYLKGIENTNTLNQLLIYFNEMLLEFNQYILDLNNKKYSPLIHNVIEYTCQNFQHEISLAFIAKHFHVNKSYLCELFKQQTNSHFNDFLTKLRIDKAKELLRQPNYNVYSAGDLVGYQNPSYFGRIFKKITGMKPSEYSKLFKK